MRLQSSEVNGEPESKPSTWECAASDVSEAIGIGSPSLQNLQNIDDTPCAGSPAVIDIGHQMGGRYISLTNTLKGPEHVAGVSTREEKDALVIGLLPPYIALGG